MKILLVLDKLHPSSGVCSVVLNYWRHLDRENYHCDFLVHEDTEQSLRDEIEAKGASIYQMPELRAKNFLGYLSALNNFFKQHREIQVLHGHIANAAAFYFIFAKLYGIRVRILHSHNTRGSDIGWKRIRNRILTTPLPLLTTHCVACSKLAADYLFGAKPRKPVFILPNAIDMNAFQYSSQTRKDVRENMQLENELIIGHVGRMVPQKNHVFLLKIFAEVLEYHPSCRLILAGSGPMEEDLKRIARALGVEQRVSFLGVRNDIANLMQAMDIFLLPSLFEGLPVVGVEAQAAGLLCVFSDTITRDVTIIPENVCFLPLDAPPVQWACRIAKYANHPRSKIDHNKLKAYDIQEQVFELQKYYKVACEDKYGKSSANRS